MSIFGIIIIIFLLVNAPRVFDRVRQRRALRERPPNLIGSAELENVRDLVGDLSDRVVRLEEERDFYKALLELPRPHPAIGSPDKPMDPGEDAGT